jgi:uncharacterized membrane protein (UPF0127 family)
MVSSRITSWMRGLAAALVIYLSLQPLVAAQEQAMELPVHPEPLIADTDKGERSFTIEIADDPGERSRGLMFRREMDDDHGMLFIFEQSQPVGFWMKNTPLPLDMIFISRDKKIVGIVEQAVPFSLDSRSVGAPSQFVLEINGGLSRRYGLKEGDSVRFEGLNLDSVKN